MIENLKNYFTSLNAAERENFAKSVSPDLSETEMSALFFDIFLSFYFLLDSVLSSTDFFMLSKGFTLCC